MATTVRGSLTGQELRALAMDLVPVVPQAEVEKGRDDGLTTTVKYCDLRQTGTQLGGGVYGVVWKMEYTKGMAYVALKVPTPVAKATLVTHPDVLSHDFAVLSTLPAHNRIVRPVGVCRDCDDAYGQPLIVSRVRSVCV